MPENPILKINHSVGMSEFSQGTVEEPLCEKLICPKCCFRIPIPNTLVGHEQFSKFMENKIRVAVENFNELLMELQYEIPEAKIFFHNRKARVMNMVEDLMKFYRDT